MGGPLSSGFDDVPAMPSWAETSGSSEKYGVVLFSFPDELCDAPAAFPVGFVTSFQNLGPQLVFLLGLLTG